MCCPGAAQLTEPAAPKSVYLAVGMISGAALGYEILLTRLFAIIQWHHYAYMIISLALLGFGASGTYLYFVRSRFEGAFVGNAAAFGLSSMACFMAAQSVPFNPLELVWGSSQALWLALIYLCLMMPFFFAANCVGLSLIRFRERIPQLYAADLIGAGVGSAGIVLALFAIRPEEALEMLACIGLAAAGIVVLECFRQHRLIITAGLCGAIAGILSASWIELHPSDYKALSRALSVVGARTIAERSSPIGLVTAVESTRIPFRHAPGLSLNAVGEPPPQIALFTDADSMSTITRFEGDLDTLEYLDQVPSALPFHLLDSPDVLVLGAGGGAGVLQALYHRANSIDAVELNPQIVELVRAEFADYAGRIYEHPQVRTHTAEARAFVARSTKSFDLIQVSLLDSFSASAAGLYALSESYLYTVEAMQDYLSHLQPNGVLAITRWVDLPPRDTAKLFATVVEALERSGVTDSDRRLVWVRTWNTSVLLLKNGHWGESELAVMRRFCERRAFDLAYHAGIEPGVLNRFNVLKQPFFYQIASALLGPDRNTFLERYKFDIRPATDDRPYFFDNFKWSSVLELVHQRSRGGAGLLELGYLIVVATLVQATLAGAALIVLPLALRSRTPAVLASNNIHGHRVCAYFICIGFGFLLMEIGFIQKFVLFLGHPLYAIALVLAAFLIFAGIGSYVSGSSKEGRVLVPILAILVVGACELLLLPHLFDSMASSSEVTRVVVCVALIASLAAPMGMLFPRALAWLGQHGDHLIPWAWAINGCASVVGAVSATVIATHLGFNAVLIIALCVYALAAHFRPGTFTRNAKCVPT